MSNPFLDGFAEQYVFGGAVDNLGSITYNLWRSFYTYGGGYTVRPFRCTVHSTKRFHLGQKIRITYRDLHQTAAVTYDSIITSIIWTFRGGHALACGGSDSRVMADCMRASKGDKVLAEARNRCIAIEKKLNTGSGGGTTDMDGYATIAYVDNLVGDISAVLSEIVEV